jgi:hypothetical protein
MSAATENKNAEKWTREWVKECLDSIEQYSREGDIVYLGEPLMALHISRKAWSYWKRKYADDEALMEQIDLIDGIFETRLFTGALRSKLNTTIAIFGLKNNYHWCDKAPADSADLPPRPPMYVGLDEKTIMVIP